MAQELARGVLLKRTPSGLPVARVHYSADPDRDPALTDWKIVERKKYSSQGVWDKEQEVVHEAGGGERLFADVLAKYSDLIFIDPEETGFEIDPDWRGLNGFDHGKTNPTAALIGKIDTEGTIYLVGEYYQSGMSPKQHKPNLAKLKGFFGNRTLADPSIFYKNQAQSDGSFKAINDLYRDEEIKHLMPAGARTEITGMERIMAHWLNLEEREPTLKIICPRNLQDIQRPMYGVHNEGCPNLIWELRRARREELSASQMMVKNASEKVVDKDNHLRDCLKYMALSLPAPTVLPQSRQIADRLAKISDPVQRHVEHVKMKAQFAKQNQPVTRMSGDWRRRLEE